MLAEIDLVREQILQWVVRELLAELAGLLDLRGLNWNWDWGMGLRLLRLCHRRSRGWHHGWLRSLHPRERFGGGMERVTVTFWINFHIEGVMLGVLLKGNFGL